LRHSALKEGYLGTPNWVSGRLGIWQT